MHFHNKCSLDNDVILTHEKIGQKLISLEDFNNFHNVTTQTSLILRDRSFITTQSFLISKDRYFIMQQPRFPWIGEIFLSRFFSYLIS